MCPLGLCSRSCSYLDGCLRTDSMFLDRANNPVFTNKTSMHRHRDSMVNVNVRLIKVVVARLRSKDTGISKHTVQSPNFRVLT